MANVDCNACEELRTAAPSLVVNGIGANECTSLQNNTGLSPGSGNDSCTDLDNLNDCLVGGLPREIKAYGDCDWKEFVKKAIENEWTVNKGVICTLCGVWSQLERLNCLLSYMMQGAEFKFSETTDTSKSHVVAGKGVSFANASSTGLSSDISVTYVAGGVCVMGGSVKCYTSDFTDSAASLNYDNDGRDPTSSTARKGNTHWNANNCKPGTSTARPNGFGSELLYEIRILKSQYPQIDRFFGVPGLNQEGGAYHVIFTRYKAGEFAPGQFGNCNRETGEPGDEGNSVGHQVPSGWEYLQCRITWIEKLRGDANGAQVTPRGLIGVRMNANNVPC